VVPSLEEHCLGAQWRAAPYECDRR
jgi:hypothetical protein